MNTSEGCSDIYDWRFLVNYLDQITVSLQQKQTQQHHFWNFILISMQTVYACGGGGGGRQRRQVADGADVVFIDTGCYWRKIFDFLIVCCA